MRRIAAALRLLLLPAVAILGQPAQATTQYFLIDGGQSTAPVENACPVWIPETNQDDCSYNQTDPSGLGVSQWIGPVFGAGYFAPGNAPQIFENPDPAVVPIPAPQPLFELGTAVGIPITKGFISIVDPDDTPGSGDELIGGTIELGAFERNLSTGPATRAVESYDRIIHRLTPVTVNSATPNASGGFDYVVGALPDMTAGFPDVLSGSTTLDGGTPFSDSFPSEVASQSSAGAGDLPYWTAAGASGIAPFEGTTGLLGTTTSATAWGYSCDAGTGPGSCDTSELLGGSDAQVSLDNVLLRVSTDGTGTVISVDAFLVKLSDLSTTVDGLDSWQATTLSATATATQQPLGFDDRVTLNSRTDSDVTADVLLNDLPGVAPATVQSISQPADGMAVLNADQTITYTPAGPLPHDSEQSIDYDFTDANSATATATLTVVVTGNAQPVAVDDSMTLDRNVPTDLNVLDNDTGLSDIPLTLEIPDGAGPDHGTADVITPGPPALPYIRYTADADYAGPDSLSYQVTDNDGDVSNVATVSLTVENPTPVAIDDDFTVENDSPSTSLYPVDNDERKTDAPLTLVITSGPDHGLYYVWPAAGTSDPYIRYTPTQGYLGDDVLTYYLTDNDGDTSNEATITIHVTDSVPATEDDVYPPPQEPNGPPPPPPAEDGVPTIIDVLGNDTGLADQPLTIDITSDPTHGTAVVTGTTYLTITYTSDAQFEGMDSFEYTVTDADGNASSPATVTVTVVDTVPIANDDNLPYSDFPCGVPTLAPNPSQRTAFDIPVTCNDEGLRDSPVTIEITQDPTIGSAEAVASSPNVFGLPAIRYTPVAGSEGTDTLKYLLHDTDGDTSNEATVTITINDSVPVAVDDAEHVVENNKTATVRVLDNDTGRDNKPLTITITQQPSHGKVSIVAGSGTSDPTVHYTPTTGYEGPDSFRYTFRDADGDMSASDASVPILVRDTVPTAVDDTTGDNKTSPCAELANSANREIPTGDSRETVPIDVLCNDTGLVDLPLTMQITQQPTHGTAAEVQIVRSNGTTWPGIGYASDPCDTTPGPCPEVSDVIKYTITDSDGDVSNEATVTLTVTDETPVAVDDPALGQSVVIEGLETPMDVLSNDSGKGNGPLTLTLTTPPLHGTVTLLTAEQRGAATPALSYQSTVPQPDGTGTRYIGPDSFSYTVTDADGDVSNVATVSFNVVSLPVATNDGGYPTPIRINENTPVTVDVLQNDGGEFYGPVEVKLIGEALHGTAVVNPDNTITFTPDPGFTGCFPSPPSLDCPYGGQGGYVHYTITDAYAQTSASNGGNVFIDVYPPPVNDSGGSSIDIEWLALLSAGAAARRRFRRSRPVSRFSGNGGPDR